MLYLSYMIQDMVFEPETKGKTGLNTGRRLTDIRVLSEGGRRQKWRRKEKL